MKSFVRSLILLVAMLPGTALVHAQNMQPFSTDGCSLFPDRALIGKGDWCSCCLAHDLAYWRGGTAEERLKADQDLRNCVEKATGSAELGEVMYAGVRMGGGPHFYTSYRWGYGWPYEWPFGREYRPLSAGEKKQADEYLARYLTLNPKLSCPDANL